MANSVMALLQPLEDENKRLKRLAILSAGISVLTAFVLMACHGPTSVDAFPTGQRYATPLEQGHVPYARSVLDQFQRSIDFADNR